MKSVAELRAALAALDSTVAETQSKADSIALDAISGNADARRELADLLRRIDQAQNERPILCAALEQAQQADARARREREAGQHAAAIGEAQESIARLLELAAKVDEMQSKFLPLLAQISETERSIWKALRCAGAAPSTAIVGRNDLAGLALDRLGLAAQGKAMFTSDRRPIAEVARAAWANVIPQTGMEAA